MRRGQLVGAHPDHDLETRRLIRVDRRDPRDHPRLVVQKRRLHRRDSLAHPVTRIVQRLFKARLPFPQRRPDRAVGGKTQVTHVERAQQLVLGTAAVHVFRPRAVREEVILDLPVPAAGRVEPAHAHDRHMHRRDPVALGPGHEFLELGDAFQYLVEPVLVLADHIGDIRQHGLDPGLQKRLAFLQELRFVALLAHQRGPARTGRTAGIEREYLPGNRPP